MNPKDNLKTKSHWLDGEPDFIKACTTAISRQSSSDKNCILAVEKEEVQNDVRVIGCLKNMEIINRKDS
ncbi:hypothetical protein INT45_001576 [Circinella minor]|uniref:Uncharacterized protein n=1 Tax=Circinella minor TaxID=1195481 RepID=A0A8H7S6D3_9FUNG|nr:hypothetical protein INT45_001576 [Circinella minor]